MKLILETFGTVCFGCQSRHHSESFCCINQPFGWGRVLLIYYYVYSYRQSVPVDFVTRELAFDSSSKASEFLNQFPLSYTGCDQTQIDCKASLPAVANI